MYCKECGKPVPEGYSCACTGTTPITPATTAKETKGLIKAGYICGFASLLILPPALGLAGTIIGVLNLARGYTGHGIAQIVISITCAFFGMLIGAAAMS